MYEYMNKSMTEFSMSLLLQLLKRSLFQAKNLLQEEAGFESFVPGVRSFKDSGFGVAETGETYNKMIQNVKCIPTSLS